MSSFIAFIISFVFCVIVEPFLIPLLRKAKFGQSILQVGPSWHKTKQGTPTMGGIGFIIAIILTVVVSAIFGNVGRKLVLIIVGALLFALIGFIDDYIKVVLKRNLGLRAYQKFLLQTVCAIGIMLIANSWGIVPSKVTISFSDIELSFAFIPLAVLVIVGASNAVNLTDGLDGLVASTTFVVCIFFAAIGLLIGDFDINLLSAISAGALLAFWLFNKHPAKVFMGDTGSLFLGALVGLLAIFINNPIALIFVGLVYVIETLSVIIQVISFKLTGKRVFKMSPLHHHFEMCGWREQKIVAYATIITLIMCGVALLTYL
ncbi:MAG: phospho-N-acetylmuramoyl-pentapeptide-transferase [Clostridiales bacterium]|jgi:phospho-N-acetylmuramoyl-pentapeptide-transferase|nr:phospho-N-acetylmuramoyl-pentapeptide-transferase [Clostridiales bacterium]